MTPIDISLVAQAVINIAACLGALVGPLVIGAFTKADVVNGWKKYYVSRQLRERWAIN